MLLLSLIFSSPNANQPICTIATATHTCTYSHCADPRHRPIPFRNSHTFFFPYNFPCHRKLFATPVYINSDNLLWTHLHQYHPYPFTRPPPFLSSQTPPNYLISKMFIPTFVTSTPLPRPLPTTPISLCRSTCKPLRMTVTPHRPAVQTPLQQYEAFLRQGNGRADDATVFETADGGLVCEWTPALAHAALKKYEQFLKSDDAEGVDITRPVYCSAEGRLVCHIN